MRKVDTKSIQNIENCNRNQIARALGCDPSAVTNMYKRGMPRKKNGFYNLTQCVLWRIAEASEKAEGGEISEESRKWMTAFRRERAKLAKIQRLEAEGELMPKEEIVREWARRVVHVCGGFEGFADRLSVILEGKSRIEIYDIIKAEVRLLRETYARNGRYTPSKRVMTILEPCIQKLQDRNWKP
jgi:hypothetical protein